MYLNRFSLGFLSDGPCAPASSIQEDISDVLANISNPFITVTAAQARVDSIYKSVSFI